MLLLQCFTLEIPEDAVVILGAGYKITISQKYIYFAISLV